MHELLSLRAHHLIDAGMTVPEHRAPDARFKIDVLSSPIVVQIAILAPHKAGLHDVMTLQDVLHAQPPLVNSEFDLIV